MVRAYKDRNWILSGVSTFVSGALQMPGVRWKNKDRTMTSKIIISITLITAVGLLSFLFLRQSITYHDTGLCYHASSYVKSVKITDDAKFEMLKVILNKEYSEELVSGIDEHFSEYVSAEGGKILAAERVWEEHGCEVYL